MSFRTLLVAILAIGLSSVFVNIAQAKELEDRKWVQVRTEHFEIRSLMGKKKSIELARQLEVFHEVARIFTGVDLSESPVRAEIFAITGNKARDVFGIEAFTGGSFRTDLRKFWVVVDDLTGDRETDIVLHNYVHFLLCNFSACNYPLWFQEGLEEYLGSLRVRSTDVVIGGVPESGKGYISQGYGFPETYSYVRRAATRQADENWVIGSNKAFLGTAWTLVHYLHNSPERKTKSGKQLALYMQQLDAGAEPVKAFETAFEMSLIEFSQEIRAYAGGQNAPGISLPLDTVLPEFAPVSKRMTREQISLALGDFALAHGQMERAERLFGIAAEDSALEEHTEAGLGKIRNGQRRIDDAQQHFERALNISNSDPYRHLDIANFWYSRAAATTEQAARDEMIDLAKSHYLVAQDLDASLVEFYAMYGQTLLLEGRDMKQALLMLEEARRLLPSNLEVLRALTEAYRVAERNDEATALTELVETRIGAAEVAYQLHKILGEPR